MSNMERTRGKGLRSDQIATLLENSDVEDFSSDEDVGDPSFVIPEIIDSSEEENSDNHTSDLNENLIDHSSGRGSRGIRRGRANNRRGRRRSLTRGSCRSTHDITTMHREEDTATIVGGWHIDNFVPKEMIVAEPSYLTIDSRSFDKIDYFNQYIDFDLVTLIVNKTNQTSVKLNGRSLNLNVKELYIYIGITLIMACINYPKLRMYWENKWRVEIIAANMARNRFLQLRNSLKLVFDDDITAEIRAKDKLWKVRPLIERMKKGCLAQKKQNKLCIDEMIIPFTGTCGIKQYCPGKPNPEGLKIFVLANPNGLVCDFDVYQGSTTYPEYEETSFGLGEKAVLNLADSLVPGHVIYFDRYFTSEKLLDELRFRGIGCSGTIMKNRIPVSARHIVADDRQLKLQGRGSAQVLVRNDGNIALVKWFDNKAVTLLSSVEASEETDICTRWCKQQKRYIPVSRPRVIRNYNLNMGGVDLADRLLAVCPYRYRTRKWTQRFMSHMIDLAVTNAWILFKQDQLRLTVPVNKIAQLRSYKMDLGEILIESNSDSRVTELDSSSSESRTPVKKKRGKPTAPLPSKKKRLHEAKHMPVFGEKQSRCRQCHYNKSRITCGTCKITLCLTTLRNCYADFHN